MENTREATWLLDIPVANNMFSSDILNELLQRENRVLHFWTMRKRRLDQCQQYVVFERSAKQVCIFMKLNVQVYVHALNQVIANTPFHFNINFEFVLFSNCPALVFTLVLNWYFYRIIPTYSYACYILFSCLLKFYHPKGNISFFTVSLLWL